MEAVELGERVIRPRRLRLVVAIGIEAVVAAGALLAAAQAHGAVLRIAFLVSIAPTLPILGYSLVLARVPV